MLHALENVFKSLGSLLIIAAYVESKPLTALVLNELRAGVKTCALKAPRFGDNRKVTMQDVTTLAGGTIISKDIGKKLEEFTPEHLGRCKKLMVIKKHSVILDGAGESACVTERFEWIKSSPREVRFKIE